MNDINKRILGKMIVRNVGHEGIDDKGGLRRLLQACIDFLQTEAGEVWKNASITIYDDDDNVFKIVSGERKHQFICHMKDGQPFIKEKKKEKRIWSIRSVISTCKKQIVKMTPTTVSKFCKLICCLLY